jgi:hypothetical protein
MIHLFIFSQLGTFSLPFGVSWSHTYRHTVGIPCTSDQPVAETSTYTGQHNRQTSMPSEGFEPATSATMRPQTYASDRAVYPYDNNYKLVTCSGIKLAVIDIQTMLSLSNRNVKFSYYFYVHKLRMTDIHTELHVAYIYTLIFYKLTRLASVIDSSYPSKAALCRHGSHLHFKKEYLHKSGPHWKVCHSVATQFQNLILKGVNPVSSLEVCSGSVIQCRNQALQKFAGCVLVSWSRTLVNSFKCI